MHRITDWLAGLSGPSVYAVVGALVFFEDALFFGFVLPGETAVLLAGALAAQGHASVYWVAVTVVVAAIAGDSVGYEVGRWFGPSILASRPLRAHQDRVEAARDLVRRRGPVAVFLGRFVAFFRALMPAIAGMSDLPYRTFLLFNALGGLVWGVLYTALGYSAGAAYGRVAGVAGRAAAIAVAVVVVIALIIWHRRRQHRPKKPTRAAGGGEAGTGSEQEPSGAGPEGPDGPEQEPEQERPGAGAEPEKPEQERPGAGEPAEHGAGPEGPGRPEQEQEPGAEAGGAQRWEPGAGPEQEAGAGGAHRWEPGAPGATDAGSAGGSEPDRPGGPGEPGGRGPGSA